MVIHFIGSSRNFKSDLPFYRKIIEVIHDSGAVMARDWIGAVVAEGSTHGYEKRERINWDDVHNENCAALKRSDVIIIESTAYSFQQGFFTSYALQHKKPTLVLLRSEDKETHPISGIKDKLLTFKTYKNEEDLEKVVNKFIRANTVSTKDLRFNFFIDRPIYNFLREMSYETGKNKSEIIRELLEQEIKRRDTQ